MYRNDGQAGDMEIEDLVRAYIPLFCVGTVEVDRATSEIRRVAEALGMAVRIYNPGEGILGDDRGAAAIDPVSLLDRIWAERNAAGRVRQHVVWILQLFHPFLRDPADPLILARLRAIHDECFSNTTTVLLVEPGFRLPPELADLLYLRFPLPGPDCLEELVASEGSEYPARVRNEIVGSLRGLTQKEAEAVLSISMARQGRFDPCLIRGLRDRVLAGRGGRFLECSNPEERLEHVGGMDRLMEWLAIRGRAFSDPGACRRYGLPAPRGMVLFGVPGCGKTLVARAIAGSWRIPLVKMNAGRLYTAEVGGSERRLYQALEFTRAMAPCVLLIDEMEKGFARTSGFSDGGVALRIQAGLLEFLQECRDRVFVVATSNGVHELPPELIRRGRWDEIFFVDLPDRAERADILRILFRRYRIGDEVWPECVQATEGFSGAEIDQAVRDTLYTECLGAGRPFNCLALVRHIRELVPLSRLREPEIEALRLWASERARLANGPRG